MLSRNSSADRPKSIGARFFARKSQSSVLGTFEVFWRVMLPVTTAAVRGLLGKMILFIPSQKTPPGDCRISAAITHPDRVGTKMANVPPVPENSMWCFSSATNAAPIIIAGRARQMTRRHTAVHPGPNENRYYADIRGGAKSQITTENWHGAPFGIKLRTLM